MVCTTLAFAQIELNFTNAGATGQNGPTQTQINTAYDGTTLDDDVTINTQGIQEWTVPATGTYTFEVYGAQGGRSYLYGLSGYRFHRSDGYGTVSHSSVPSHCWWSIYRSVYGLQ